MIRFILFVVLAILFSYFAVQNTERIVLHVASYSSPALPLYAVIGATFLLGLAFSWLMNIIHSFTFKMRLREKESALQEQKRTIHDLTKQVNKLEIENAELKGKLDGNAHDDSSL